HYALLGLTTPLVREMGVEPSLYNWGDRETDTFIDLKVGDYAHRMMSRPAPLLCSPAYDEASGQLFARAALTFPADLVTHAYGAALIVLRSGFTIPLLSLLRKSPTLTELAATAGPLATLIAIAVAWSASVRYGVALTGVVLFLCGYPAIQFEYRHWFHL